MDDPDLKSRRTGTRGRGRSDQDLTVRIKGGHDLISPVDNRSNGQEKKEARAGGADRRRKKGRGGAARELAGDTRSRVPGDSS
jgi:hypothetical protein